MAFRIPEVPFLLKKNHSIQKVYDELPVTLSKDVQIVKEVGRGSFGRVMLCIKEGKKQVILKEMRKCSDQQAKLFVKEAKIIHKFTHKNVVHFDSLYQSDDPDTLAFLMEYVYFDFKLFKQDLKVSSLAELLLRLDKFDCKEFEHFQMVIAKDITKGLSYLHENDVVHRDLKPDNVLISNQHYSNPLEMEKEWMLKPVVAKITDFGESRTSVIQTLTLIGAETSNICRGTAVFLAPEAYSDHSVKFRIKELKNIDIWALLMIFYILINPNKSCPFEDEIRRMHRAGNVDIIMIMKHIFKNHSAPKHSDKYQRLRHAQWRTISDIFETGTSTRRPSVGEILLNLEKEFNSDRNLEKMGKIAKIDKDLASICKGKEMLNDGMLLMFPESNWGQLLTPAPFAIELLGDLIFISADTNFSLEGKRRRGDYQYIRFPNSFRAAFFQVRSAFNKAHTSMDEIFLLSGRIDGHVENAVRFLIQGTPNEVVKMLPMSLTKIRNIPDQSLNLANEIEQHFICVLELINELIEACLNTKTVYDEKSCEIERAINVAKIQREQREKVVNIFERIFPNKKKEDREMAQLDLKHTEVNTIRDTLIKYIKTLAEVKEEWGKLFQYFQMLSNLIKGCLHTSLQTFLDRARAGRKIKMLDFSTPLSYAFRHIIFEQASKASRIAYVVRTISGTYVQISNKHLMDMITCLERIIARNLQKDEHEIRIRGRELHSVCIKAQKSIQSIIVEQTAEFNQNIEERMRKIAEIDAKLPSIKPKREEEIKKSDVMKTFTDAEIDDFV